MGKPKDYTDSDQYAQEKGAPDMSDRGNVRFSGDRSWWRRTASVALSASLGCSGIFLSACGGTAGQGAGESADMAATTTSDVDEQDVDLDEIAVEDGEIVEGDMETVGDDEEDSEEAVPEDGDDAEIEQILTEEEYASKLAAYDKKHKEGDAYVGKWFRCECPDDYYVPAYRLDESWVPVDFLLVGKDSPERLGILDEANLSHAKNDLHGSGKIWLLSYFAGVSASERAKEAKTSESPNRKELDGYDAATGTHYRMFESVLDGSIYVVGEWENGVVELYMRNVSDEAMHGFLDGLVPDGEANEASKPSKMLHQVG
jgi:hypothetical protein